jgi:hypothetical protein
LLTTTHYNNGYFENVNIVDGSFKKIDLLSLPYSFRETDILYSIDDWIAPYPARRMILLEKNTIKALFKSDT